MTHRRQLAALCALLVAANGVAWLWAWAAFAGRPALLGLALLAWVFGLRHAVDADHIAAIDNAVRKLVQDGKRPIGAGCYFSLGHSTVVVLLTIGVAVAAGRLQDWMERIQSAGSVIGTAVSAAFLLAIAVTNLAALPGLWRGLAGTADHQALERLLNGRGVLTRLLRPVFRAIRHSWHMFPIGFLFGLGFDTATEIGMLSIAATQAAQGLSGWHVLVFPVLFTTGMSLVDTLDGGVMLDVYAWAFVDPLRRLWYNLAVTAASAAIAIGIGGVEVLGLLGDRLGWRAGPWRPIAALNQDMTTIGAAVIGGFVLIWGVSAACYRASTVIAKSAGTQRSES